MKYFVMSDIHGHYDLMKKVLQEANYDEHNPGHKLIIAGDMFDRGSQSKEVYEYLYRLNQEEKAIIIKGNHEIFLEELFTYQFGRVDFNRIYNGLDETLKSFIPNFDQIKKYEDVTTFFQEHYPELESWIMQLPYYYETEHYVITHAGLDFSKGDFRKGNFSKAVWMDPEYLFEEDLVKKYQFNKKLVVGHRMTFYVRRHFHPELTKDFSIYYHDDEQKIAIDGGSYHTQHLNVLIFEE